MIPPFGFNSWRRPSFCNRGRAFRGLPQAGEASPRIPSICLVHKDAWSHRFVVSFLKFSLRDVVTTIVTNLPEMEGSTGAAGVRRRGPKPEDFPSCDL